MREEGGYRRTRSAPRRPLGRCGGRRGRTRRAEGRSHSAATLSNRRDRSSPKDINLEEEKSKKERDIT